MMIALDLPLELVVIELRRLPTLRRPEYRCSRAEPLLRIFKQCVPGNSQPVKAAVELLP